jgi:hypothetical protein
MPLQQTSGNVTADAYGGGVAVVPNYIEDVFSTYLYTGNGSTQTITNGIDLAGKGGLVWQKNRSSAGYDHVLTDTITSGTGALTNFLSSNTTNSFASNQANIIGSYNSNGFTLNSGSGWSNNNSVTAVSWTFRKQPKFFDVVTYTGDGSTTRNISHVLGATPGCVIVKNCTDSTDWWVWHRAAGANGNAKLNTTNAFNTSGWIENVTSTTFGVSRYSNSNDTNISGKTYVAYLFAHNAGGFGLTGTDNVISCGSFTANSGATITVNLGYEPQWMLTKNITTAGYDWQLVDTMRGWGVDASSNYTLQPNTSAAENPQTSTGGRLTSTGVQFFGQGGTDTYIYIAIRRGPMKVPTDGTKVFSPILNGAGSAFNVGFVPDMNLTLARNGTSQNMNGSRLVGNDNRLETNNTGAEQNYPDTFIWNGASNTFIQNIIGGTPINWMYKRAPSFFDEVCYTGNGTSNTAIAHNLTAIPELWIVKARNQGTRNWQVYYNLSSSSYARLILNTTDAGTTGIAYNAGTNLYAQPTSTNLYLMNGFPNTSAETYVSYLFATCAGVSKVGSYTGNGTTQTINCGFAGGARFVLIKRTDSTGDWYVYDTARGMTTLTDPYLLMNSTAAETATLGSVTTVSTGFAVNASILAAINASGGTYIFLAIA